MGTNRWEVGGGSLPCTSPKLVCLPSFSGLGQHTLLHITCKTLPASPTSSLTTSSFLQTQRQSTGTCVISSDGLVCLSRAYACDLLLRTFLVPFWWLIPTYPSGLLQMKKAHQVLKYKLDEREARRKSENQWGHDVAKQRLGGGRDRRGIWVGRATDFLLLNVCFYLVHVLSLSFLPDQKFP